MFECEKEIKEYTEIFKLKKMLEDAHISFEWVKHNDFRNGYQICYPEKNGVCSVIEHLYSYGSEKDLLEIQGLLTPEEEKDDDVLGWLTADNVFQRILSHWNGTKENAELDCQIKRNFYCYSCKNATEKCYRKEIGCPCGKYDSYKDENAKLKTEIERLKLYGQFAVNNGKNFLKQIAELEARLKEHENIGNTQFWENVWSWKLKADQVTKAKDIIKKLVEGIRIISDPKVCLTDVDTFVSEAEQFVKEIESDEKVR